MDFKEYVAQTQMTPEEELEMLNDRIPRFQRMANQIKGLKYEIWEMESRKESLEKALRLLNQKYKIAI
jgi:hypothetical protein